MSFIARSKELYKLKLAIESPSASLIVSWGRRRVGKTTLIRHFCKSEKITFLEFAGRLNQTMTQQLSACFNDFNKYVPDLDASKPKSWQGFFNLLESYIDRRNKDEAIVIFLDEVPWFDTRRSGFHGHLAHFWNSFCVDRPNVNLVLCGSAASYMLNKIVNDKGPLHGRVTHKLYVKPFNLNDSKTLLESKGWRISLETVTKFYMAVGGVSKYLSAFDSRMTPQEAIQNLCFDDDAILKTEYSQLMASLFNEASVHNKVMNLLATRWDGLTQKEIIAKTKLSAGAVNKVLSGLVSSGFLDQRTRFGASKRGALYLCADMFSYFHFKWIASYNGVPWNEIELTAAYRNWTGHAFEKICHLHIDEIKRAMNIGDIPMSAHYWSHVPIDEDDTGAQIDLLLRDERNKKNIEIVECKYYEGPYTITKSYKENLKNKIRIFNEQTNFKYNIRLWMITKEGIKRNQHSDDLNLRSLTLDHLFI